MEICDIEKVNYNFIQVEYTPEGLEAVIFTSEGDMRQAVNNLQSTHAGFGLVIPDHVYKVCDQPHPVLVNHVIKACIESAPDIAMQQLESIWEQGFSSVDIITTVFKVVKAYDMPEMQKLEFIKVTIDFIRGNWNDSYACAGRMSIAITA